MAASANCFEDFNLLHGVPSPAELEQRRLDRLRELRAVIESLRSERAGKDPLLCWVVDQENSRDR